jgi:dTDP-4-dehydrorhamnose 3,5-epimerase
LSTAPEDLLESYAVKLTETVLKGAFIIEPERIEDERGFFARTFCRREFEARGLDPNLVQCSVSYNRRRGTLRGMHYQVLPHQEAKLVSCLRGAIYDVIVDLRRDSATFKRWTAVELNQANCLGLYIPKGMAHGFQTLMDETEVFYQISEFYVPECSRGVGFDDPAFQIVWPFAPTVLSDKDRNHPNFVT